MNNSNNNSNALMQSQSLLNEVLNSIDELFQARVGAARREAAGGWATCASGGGVDSGGIGSLVFGRGSQPLQSAGLIGSVVYAGAVGSLQNMIVLLDRDGVIDSGSRRP